MGVLHMYFKNSINFAVVCVVSIQTYWSSCWLKSDVFSLFPLMWLVLLLYVSDTCPVFFFSQNLSHLTNLTCLAMQVEHLKRCLDSPWPTCVLLLYMLVLHVLLDSDPCLIVICMSQYWYLLLDAQQGVLVDIKPVTCTM